VRAQAVLKNWIDRGELPAVRLGRRRVRIKRTDLDAFIAAGSSSEGREHPDGELVTKEESDAWGAFGTALAEANAKLAEPDRAELVASLESLAQATKQLARVLGA
jgi:hypothetical protein